MAAEETTDATKTTAEQVATSLRSQILDLEAAFKEGKNAINATEPIEGEDRPEELANITLAFRHLEDARMRLGKVIQAATGGVSIYDKQAGNASASNDDVAANTDQENGAASTDASTDDSATTDSEQEPEPQEGDPCTMPDGKTQGTLKKEHDGTLTCSVGA